MAQLAKSFLNSCHWQWNFLLNLCLFSYLYINLKSVQYYVVVIVLFELLYLIFPSSAVILKITDILTDSSH